MAKLSAATLLFVLVLPSAGRLLGQGEPPPEKTKKPSEPATQKVSPELEELGARALKNNPDIRVARERVRFAQARVRGREEELNRARLQVAKNVAALELEIRGEQGKLDRARESVKAMQNPKICLSANEYKRTRLTVVKHEAKLAVLQAQRDYLQGKQLFPGKEVSDTREPPEVAVAQARLQTAQSQAREAEADLNRVRREVLNQVVVMHRALVAEKAELTEVQEQHVRNQDLLRKGATTEEEVRLSGFEVEASQARLATLRADLAHLLGEQPEQGKATKSGKDSKEKPMPPK
jgi:outer membrane protein TolC